MNYDVMVVGGGIVGSAVALALAQQTNLRIALLEAKNMGSDFSTEEYDSRVSAISLASKRIFENLSVWSRITAQRVSPYFHMHVWEKNTDIHFDHRDVYQPVLGYIIEDRVMRNSLYDAIMATKKIDCISPLKIISLAEKTHGIELYASNNQIFTTQLLIAADGAHSEIRAQANIPLKTHDYHHIALVCTVKTEQAHQATARQCFLRTGPLAFLPLADSHLSSIVWSTTPDNAKELLTLSNEKFHSRLAEALDFKLGNVMESTSRLHFPLMRRHASHYVKANLALIGDAAHTLHPLAGQGVNLGLLDAVSLSQVVADAHSKQRDFASLATLRRYERWRKSDNLIMLAAVDAIKNLFMSEKPSVQSLRRQGLNLTNRLSFLKNFLVHYALGNQPDLPLLAR